MKTKFIKFKKDGALESENDIFSQKLSDAYGDDIFDEHGEVVINKANIREYIQTILGCVLNDKEFNNFVDYLKGEYDNVDLTLFLKSDYIMKFLADIENQHPVILKQKFNIHIKRQKIPQAEKMYALSNEFMDSYKIPPSKNITSDVSTYGGTIITSTDVIPGIFELKAGKVINFKHIPCLIREPKIRTTEDGSILYCGLPDFHLKEWHNTSINIDDIKSPQKWSNLILTIAHCVMEPVDKSEKTAFAEMMIDMINDDKVPRDTDTKSADMEEILIDLEAYATKAKSNKIRWTYDFDKMISDDNKKTIYIYENNKKNITEVMVPTTVLHEFCELRPYGYRHLKNALNLVSTKQPRKVRPVTVTFDYEYIESWHNACKASPNNDEMGNPKENNGNDQVPKNKIPLHSEQSRMIEIQNTEIEVI